VKARKSANVLDDGKNLLNLIHYFNWGPPSPAHEYDLSEKASTDESLATKRLQSTLFWVTTDLVQYTAAEKDLTSKNSTSILRRPGAKEDFVRGRSGQFPFAPGGMEPLADDVQSNRDPFRITEKTTLGPLISIPPGFARGLRLSGAENTIDLEGTEVEDGTAGEEVVRSIHMKQLDGSRNQKVQKTGYEGIDDLLPDAVPMLSFR